jgi:Fe-S oxidoreductase
MEGAFPGEEVEAAARSTEMSGNPLGIGGAGRGDWAEGLDVVTLPSEEPVDLLYFVGCYASFDPRNQKVARAFVEVCGAAGLRIGILGSHEKCCGEPMRKLGNEYLYQMLAAENLETLQSCGAQRVVTTCPHCFNTLSRDYRELGLELPVEHQTTFLADLLDAGRLPIAQEPFQVTYHDSCYLGRYMGIYDAPRALLAAAGGTVREMSRHGEESFCCGGGGGRVLADERIGTRISDTRMSQAQATGAGLLVANCPFCMTMFEDSVRSLELESTLRVVDLAELLAERTSTLRRAAAMPASAGRPDVAETAVSVSG